MRVASPASAPYHTEASGRSSGQPAVQQIQPTSHSSYASRRPDTSPSSLSFPPVDSTVASSSPRSSSLSSSSVVPSSVIGDSGPPPPLSFVSSLSPSTASPALSFTSSVSTASSVSTRATFRQLLAQVEWQLASLTELSCTVRTRGFGTPSSSLSFEEAKETFETLRTDTFSSLDRANRLLRQLRVVSSTSSSSASSSACSPAQLRHFENLFLSLKTECVGVCESISMSLDRAALLHGPLSSGPSDKEGDKKDKDEEDDESQAAIFYSRKEAEHLQESNRMLSSILQAGSNALHALRKQKAVVRSMKGKVHELSSQDTAAITGLLGRIEWHGKKQKLILAFVIAFCVCLSFLWITRGHSAATSASTGGADSSPSSSR
ncbi:transmembrane protein [Cystoisospora suis]|uniref:Transmembrane protein n=1 Tax=Cystoisospora suis TaxID=483139 RepID=A0A2C6L7Z3_9APIC|nr:transmembrane protein [Cystoisospora suis]